MRILGVDVGMGGAAAVFGHRGGPSNFPQVLDVYDMRTVGEDGAKRIDVLHFHLWVREFMPDRAYIENAMLMPSRPGPDGARRGMGAATGGRYMRSAGHQEAAVACAGVEVTLVSPAPWKRFFGLVGPNKNQSIERAIELCPEAARWLSRKKDHNRAEAILIAVYGAVRMGLVDLEAVTG